MARCLGCQPDKHGNNYRQTDVVFGVRIEGGKIIELMPIRFTHTASKGSE